MEPIYVTGHRNPDTDSIVSAMAYAALRNALGDREFVPARLGHISDETKLILDRFGFEPPIRIQTMRTQVRDLAYDTPPALSSAVTVSHAWSVLTADSSIAAIPVTNEDGTLYGMLSAGDIAACDMRSIERPHIDEVPVFNLLSVLEGRILNEAGNLIDTITGDVTIALPQSCENLLFSGKDSIVVVGHQPDMVRRAIAIGVNCVIVCQAELDEELRTLPTDTCIISTPFDAYRAVRELAQMLAAPGRVLPGGFIYMADILAMPDIVERMGTIIASQYYRTEPDFVLTMETKGIPVAMMTAKALGVPTVIVRRDSKVYEGPAVNINYLSGSGGRVETMSLSRRAVREGQRALIVDDFMRAGGTARGMVDMMREFAVTVVGVCVLVATQEPQKKRIDGVKSLLIIDDTDESSGQASIRPAPWLAQAAEKARA